MDRKEIKIEDIQLILKISVLFFCAIAFFQHYLSGKNLYILFTQDVLYLISVVIVLLVVYFFWSFIVYKTANKQKRSVQIQTFLFLVICFATIWLTGGPQSDYKFILILVIISATIEGEAHLGSAVSFFSGAYIIAVDLIYTNGNSVTNKYLENDLVLICVFIVITITIGYYVSNKQGHISILENLINIDELTGSYNGRWFREHLDKQLKDADDYPVSALVVNIDAFKTYNSMFGHDAGDEILKQTVELIRDTIYDGMFFARKNGDEFVIACPRMNAAEAAIFADTLRNRFESTQFYGQKFLTRGILTVSIGIADFPNIAKSGEELVALAGEALYSAKFLRKNRVEIYTSFQDEFKNYALTVENQEIMVSVRTLIAVINSKDKYTYMHVDRVVKFCKYFAEYLGLSESDCKALINSSYMHDIGKINIPQSILCKSDKLTDDEWNQLKQHPAAASQILENMNSMQDVVMIVRHHHERYDGHGYPDRIKGTEIEYLARILTICDSFDAMTAERPYKLQKTFDEACDEILANSGTQFDPILAESFVTFIKSTT